MHGQQEQKQGLLFTWNLQLALGSPLSVSPNLTTPQRLSNKEKSPKAQFHILSGGTFPEAASCPSPIQAYSSWAQTQLMGDTLSSYAYRVFKIPPSFSSHL